jgi:uncharacterized protein
MILRRNPLLAFFGLSYFISWILWAPLWLPALGMPGLPALPFNHALGAFGPLAAAFILTGLQSGREGVRALLGRMGLWRGRLSWITLALLAPFALVAAAAGAGSILHHSRFSLEGLWTSGEFPSFSFAMLLLYNIFTFGFGEETGWRGYALPRLQARHSALTATLLLTLGWALWHLPLFLYRPGYAGMGPGAMAGWLVSLVTGAILLTWLFNSSRGSLLVVALFHATIDIAFTSDLSDPFVINAMGAALTLWGLGIVFIAGPRDLSRAGKVLEQKV